MYGEEFYSNVSDNFSEVDVLLKELPEGPAKDSVKVKIELVKLAASQASESLKSMIFGNTYVCANRGKL